VKESYNTTRFARCGAIVVGLYVVLHILTATPAITDESQPFMAPEPGGILTLGLGAGGVIGYLVRRRKFAAQAPLEPVSEDWEHVGLTGWKATIKRIIDVCLASITLVILLPLMVAIAIVIKLDSKGPALFKQTRVGKSGRKFILYKFRSMLHNAEQIRDSLMHLNEADGPVFKIGRDPRITRTGSFIRKTSLDELPQLINVLRGDMSLVGPRPPLPCEVEKYSERQWRRLKVTPGVTCIWQVSGRSDVPFDRWVEMDIEYIRNQSLWLDFKILLKTIPTVLLQRGAR